MNKTQDPFDDLYPPILKSDLDHFKMGIQIEKYFKDLEDSYEYLNRYKIFLTDVNVMARYSSYISPHNENEIIFSNNLFGPVGLMWNDDHTQPMTANSFSFKSIKEKNRFMRKEKPLIYQILEYDALNPYTFEKETKYVVRCFPEVGKLSWFKYQIQFFSSKFKNNKIRAFLYRLLVVK